MFWLPSYEGGLSLHPYSYIKQEFSKGDFGGFAVKIPL